MHVQVVTLRPERDTHRFMHAHISPFSSNPLNVTSKFAQGSLSKLRMHIKVPTYVLNNLRYSVAKLSHYCKQMLKCLFFLSSP